DHAFSAKHRIFGHVTWDYWRDVKDNFFFNESTGLETDRTSQLVGIDDVYMFSSNVVLNVRGGLLRQPSTRGPRVTGIDYSTLGFVPELPNLIPEQPLAFPVISLSGKYRGFGIPTYLVLNENTLLLEYALGDEHSYLWAVTTTGMTAHTLPKRAEIEK